MFRLLKGQLRKMVPSRPNKVFWRFARWAVLTVLVSLAAGICPLCGFSAPLKDEVEVRLTTPLTSYATKAGALFECVVLRDYVSNNLVVIPQGATVHGHVGRVVSVGLGARHERARLDLVFDDFVASDGRRFPLFAKLSSIDNAREQVKSGSVRGVLAASQPNQLVLGMWRSPSLGLVSRSLVGFMGLGRIISTALPIGPVGAGGLVALRLALFRFPEPEIQYGPGIDMSLRVDPTLQQGVQTVPANRLAAPDAVSEWLRKEPFGIDRRDNRPIADMVNVAFLGSRQELENAFLASGWAKADPLKSKTKSKTVLRI